MSRAVSVFSIVAVFVGLVSAHENTRGTATVEVGKGRVTIEYGTPQLKGRSLDEMVQPGVTWRMGMDNPTTLETSVALRFGEKKLPAGKYTMFARADEKNGWVLLLSSANAARLDPSTVVVETPLRFMKDDVPQESLKITLERAAEAVSLRVAWGTYRLHCSFQAA